MDVFHPAAREWFWGFYKRQMEAGAAGWWGDLGEPETHPGDIRHVNGRGEDVHNAYGHTWARMVFEGTQRDFPRMRPFNLMRSGFVGSQRYGMFSWQGSGQAEADEVVQARRASAAPIRRAAVPGAAAPAPAPPHAVRSRRRARRVRQRSRI